MTAEKIKKLLEGQSAYRVRQAVHAVFRNGISSFEEITSFPAALRSLLKDVAILSMEPETVQVSKDRLAHKAVMRLQDGKKIETVLMMPKPGLWTACISSQVGCALKCSFCATGLMGFDRNLTAEEIADQVLFWRQYMRKLDPGKDHRLSNVVYMGMGEPFLNIDNVLSSLGALSDPEQFGIGHRHISVSTVGIIPGLDRFAKNSPQVNLAISLHAATPELRSRLVPINKNYSLERLRESLKDYFRHNNRKVFIEYVLLEGENDREKDAEALLHYLKTIGPAHLLHVNLIVWNPTETPHQPSRRDAADRFFRILRNAGQPATFRKNLGQDIAGACGQLVVNKP